MSSRAALIDAARSLLCVQGFEATSPRDIQRVSGVGQGSFYHHFAGKAELAAVALDEQAAEMCREFDELSDELGMEQVRAYLGVDRDALMGCRIGRISMESSVGDDRIREPIGRYFDHLRAGLKRAFQELDIGIDPGALADLAIASVQGGYVISRSVGDPAPMQQATSALLALIELAASPQSDAT